MKNRCQSDSTSHLKRGKNVISKETEFILPLVLMQTFFFFFFIYSVGTLPDIRTNKCKTYVVLNDTIVNK